MGEADTSAPEPPVDAATSRSAARTILLIEDDPSSVRLLQTFLDGSGYDVAVAPDGETGLRMATANPPAAILLDVLLPTIDGWEARARPHRIDVLAIDDDPVSLDVIDATLAPLGFDVRHAASGQEGLDKVVPRQTG